MNDSKRWHQLIAGQERQGKHLCVLLRVDERAFLGAISAKEAYDIRLQIVGVTKDIAAAYMIDSSLVNWGLSSIEELPQLIQAIKNMAPEVPIIIDLFKHWSDQKRREIQLFGADGLVLYPSIGDESIKAFFEDGDYGGFVVCRSKNSHSGATRDIFVAIDTQDFPACNSRFSGNGRKVFRGSSAEKRFCCIPLYQYVAARARYLNEHGNCALIVDNDQSKIRVIRRVTGEEVLLLATGVKEKKIAGVVESARNGRGGGFLISTGTVAADGSRVKDYPEIVKNRAERLDAKIRAALKI